MFFEESFEANPLVMAQVGDKRSDLPIDTMSTSLLLLLASIPCCLKFSSYHCVSSRCRAVYLLQRALCLLRVMLISERFLISPRIISLSLFNQSSSQQLCLCPLESLAHALWVASL